MVTCLSQVFLSNLACNIWFTIAELLPLCHLKWFRMSSVISYPFLPSRLFICASRDSRILLGAWEQQNNTHTRIWWEKKSSVKTVQKSGHQGIFDFDISTANSNNKTPHQNSVKVFTQSTPHSTAKSAQSTNCGTELDFSALLSSASEQKANYDVTSRS